MAGATDDISAGTAASCGSKPTSVRRGSRAVPTGLPRIPHLARASIGAANVTGRPGSTPLPAASNPTYLRSEPR